MSDYSYATVAAVVSALGFPGTPTADILSRIGDSLDAAEGRVNDYCDREFTPARAEVREIDFDPADIRRGGQLPTPDHAAEIVSVALTNPLVARQGTVTLNTRIWYSLPLRPERRRPYTAMGWIETPDWGRQYEPGDRLSLAAAWGWSAVPDPVKTATILLASRHFRRQDAPLGIAGTGDFGVAYAARSDADAYQLLEPYKRIRLR